MKRTLKTSLGAIALLALAWCPLPASAQPGAVRGPFMQRHGQAQMGRAVDPAALPAGIRIMHDVAYGSDPLQKLDVYAPPQATGAPVIFMVHGGGWRRGDKTARGVVQNKVIHWVPRGIIVISVNYPLLPQATPLAQARSVGKALAFAQRHATEWGGDREKFVLMGHSAGAHLVALISAEPSLATAQGALPWLGTVALDSAAYDVAQIMQTRHFQLYDEAFGSDPAVWAAVSPAVQLHASIAPFLAVCSSRRADSCTQARRFADKARTFGARVEVLPEDMRHGVINAALGEPSAYTNAVDTFLASLDPSLAARLR
ncbi:MAG: alpha/beta hydrolase [Rhodanobacteraceae bacterium]|nr:MAG: alpha/beta hydrolase [Rhodanobacteraceae bacterium]